MISCAELDAIVTPYLDNEVSPEERVAVEAHLAACHACRNRTAAERAARDLLHSRAASLSGTAPAALHARCTAAARTIAAESRTASHRPSRRWIPLSMAATLLLAAAGVLMFGFNYRLQAALAEQLAQDHVKCFSRVAADAEVVDPRGVEDSLRASSGWDIKVPDGEGERLELVGGRHCRYREGRMAHLMYRVAGRPISLFVLPDRKVGRRVLEVMGHEAVLWVADDRTYALVGREPVASMQHLAASLQQASR